MTFPSVQIVELIAFAGFHFVQIDGEHGPFSPEDIEFTCLAAQAAGLTVTARIPSLDPGTITSYLDRGVQGILAPHVESSDEAEALVSACRFAPDGERSWGGGRALHFNDPTAVQGRDGSRADLMARANAELIVMAQLESKTALDAIDDLLSVPGIDYFAFGPNDPAIKAAMAQTVQRAHAVGRKMTTDDMSMTYVQSLLLDAGRAFVESN